MAAHAAEWAQHGTLGAAAQDTVTLNEARLNLKIYNRSAASAGLFFRVGRGALANVPDITAVTNDDTHVAFGSNPTVVPVPFGSGAVIVKLFSATADIFSVVESE